MSVSRPLFRKLDNLLLRVADLDAAVSFYRDRLGHRVVWRSDEAVGFALPDTDAELVAHLHIGPETDVLVEDVDEAVAAFLSAGGEALRGSVRHRDRALRACSRPLRQRTVLLDQSKGVLATDRNGRVVGVTPNPVARVSEASGDRPITRPTHVTERR